MVKFKDETIDFVNNLLNNEIEHRKSSLITNVKLNSSDETILNHAKNYREAWNAYENFNDVVYELGQED